MANKCKDCGCTCKRCIFVDHDVQLHVEIENLKQKLLERDNHIVTMETTFLNEANKFPSGELTSIKEELLTWQDKYKRLYEAHRRVQRVNQGLEDKLLKLVDVCETDKTALTKDVATLSHKLADANYTIKKLKEENTWHDIKTRTKSKSSKVKQHRVRTGGGPPINIEITKDDEKILGIMGSVVVEGHPNVSESHVLFEDSTITDYHGTVPTSEKHSTKDDHCYSLVDLEVSPNILDITNSDNLRKSSTSYFNEPIPTTSSHLLDKTNSSTTNVYEATKDMNKIKKKIIHVPKRLQRLDKTILATQILADQTERDITMRQEYLCKKLDLYKEDIAVKARIASALESIAQSIV